MAIAKENKRRYGLNGLNKEEKQKLKMRTKKRLELAQARTKGEKTLCGSISEKRYQHKKERKSGRRSRFKR